MQRQNLVQPQSRQVAVLTMTQCQQHDAVPTKSFCAAPYNVHFCTSFGCSRRIAQMLHQGSSWKLNLQHCNLQCNP
jgi:hypothetical protein